uniref:Uncharacterized protein n=1 Tax=Peronospora matthiolae TaxID=2874970 RepID=A0AAV1TVD9_9STRA
MQGKKLSYFFQELRTLIAAVQLDPLLEKVRVTIFKEEVRTGVVRTEVFRVHPSTFEEAVDMALNTKFNVGAACFRIHGRVQRSFDGVEHMEFSPAEEEEVELQDVEH